MADDTTHSIMDGFDHEMGMAENATCSTDRCGNGVAMMAESATCSIMDRCDQDMAMARNATYLMDKCGRAVAVMVVRHARWVGVTIR